jgi:hypothetical protein
MPRTFSLARLMIGITAFSIFCGVAVNYPFALFLLVIFAIPLAILWIALVVLFLHRTAATIATVFAAIELLGKFRTVELLKWNC